MLEMAGYQQETSDCKNNKMTIINIKCKPILTKDNLNCPFFFYNWKEY
jgi:hypothetical protein